MAIPRNAVNSKVSIFKKVVMGLLILSAVLIIGALNRDSRLAGNSQSTGTVRLENRYMKLQYDTVRNAFRIENKSNGRVYLTEPQFSYRTVSATATDGTGLMLVQEFNDEYNGITVTTQLTLDDERIKGVMKAAKDASLPKHIDFPGAFCGEEQGQFFAIPYAEGIYVPADRKCEFGDFEMWAHKSTMPFTGMTDSKTGIMITSDTPWDTSLAFVKAAYGDKTNYLMQLEHFPSKGRFGYDRVFYIDLVENDGYNEMAQKYRRHLEYRQYSKKTGEPDVLVTLREKAKQNGNVKKLIGAVDFWLGPWEMKKNEIIDDLMKNGVEKAVINFKYGWNVYKGENRPEVVRYAADFGFITSRYDNYSDIYAPDAVSISPRYRTEKLSGRTIIKDDGSYQEGFASYSEGQLVQGYRLNSGLVTEDVDTYLGQDLKENGYTGRFVDVMVSCRLYEDYSDSHPMTRSEDMLNRYRLLDRVSSDYGMVTGTEETTWWAVPVTHYSEGTLTIAAVEIEDWTSPIVDPGKLYTDYTVNPAVRIPLKSLVYHDCHVSGWYTGDSLSRVIAYWDTKDLITVLYGAMGLAFPDNEEFWIQNRDRYLRSIKLSCWVFEKVGYEKMTRHDFLTGDRLVQRTQFSNRMSVVANFSDCEYLYEKTIIPAGDFIFISGSRVYTSDQIEKE